MSGSTSNWQGRGQGIPPVVPVGSMFLWAASTAPQDFLLCNGQAISRTQFTSLFSIIGTTWGAGDGSTTFNVPNTGGRVVRGVNGTYTQALTGGADTVTLAANQLPNHAHSYTEPNSGTGHKHTTAQPGGQSAAGLGPRAGDFNTGGPDTGFAVTGIVINDSLTVGGAQQTQVSTSLVNPFIGINYVIKAQ